MAITRTPRSDYCPRNHQTTGDVFYVQQYYSTSRYSPPPSHDLNEGVRAFVEEYYHMLCHSPAEAAKFYDYASELRRYENDGYMSVTTTPTDICDKILSLKYDKFVDIIITSLDVGMYISSVVPVTVNGFLTRKDYNAQRFVHQFLLVPLKGGFVVSRDTFIHVEEFLYADFMHSDYGKKLAASDVDDIYFSVGTLSRLEKVCKCPRQLAEESANGEVSVVKEEEPPVPEVLDQVQDNPHMVVQSAGKIEEIVSDRGSASTPLSSGNEFQEERFSLGNCRRRKVAKKTESHGPANAELQQLDHGIAEVVDEVQDDSQMVVQSVVKIEKVLKKASASIDRGRPSASSNSQEGEASYLDPHRNKVPKTMESQSRTNAELEQLVHAIADEYFKLRQTADEHRGKSEYYKNKLLQANTPHTKRKQPDKNSLSEQASSEAEKARKVQTEALWASLVIFTARSMICNYTLTIDLHYQSVDDAMWYMKRYLKLLSSIQCVLILKVITGKGLNSKDGVPKIKPAVIIFLDNEEIEWGEEKGNPGALLIKLDGKRVFKFGPG